MNHTGYEDRLTFVKHILLHEFNLVSLAIQPIDYDAECPFPYNNYVYRVDVANGSDAAPARLHTRAGTVPLQTGETCFAIRLSNSAASGIFSKNRVENEVAMMELFRQALHETSLGHLVPKVYGWGSAADGQGWILQEFKSGELLSGKFASLDAAEKVNITTQIAQVIKAMQRFPIPPSIDRYGGVTFTVDGEMKSGSFTTLASGPFDTWQERYHALLRQQLKAADSSPIIAGWSSKGTRYRLEEFLAKGLSLMMETCNDTKKVIVHGDLTTDNILFDEASTQLTALLDFDWSFIGTAADDFLMSFGNFGGIPGPYDNNEEAQLRHSILVDFAGTITRNPKHEDAEIWYTTLARLDATRPATISGFAQLSAIHWFISQVGPWLLTNEVALQRAPRDRLEQARERSQDSIIRFLTDHGF